MLDAKAYVSARWPTIYRWLFEAKRKVQHWKRKAEEKNRQGTIFSKIYAQNSWGGGESRSGTGSSLAQTQHVREQLPILLKKIGAKTFLDAPCGDFHWLKDVDLGVEQYIGVDIVEKLVHRNEELYGNQSRRFLTRDISRDILPKADIIFCRDCLGHLSFADIRCVVRNLSRSRSTYLLVTTFPDLKDNQDIKTGAWRPLNLQSAPFCFPEPVKLINENCTEIDGKFSGKSLGLWQTADLPL